MQQPPKAGWYPDPEHRNYLRYWNGQQWTDRRVPIDVGELIEATKPGKALTMGLNIVNAIGLVAITGVLVVVIMLLSG